MSSSSSQDTLSVGIRDGSHARSSTTVNVRTYPNTIPHPGGELAVSPLHPGERSQSASRAENRDGRHDRRRSKSRGAPNPRERERSASNHRATSSTREARKPHSRSQSFERHIRAEKGLSSERVNMFLRSMGQVPNDTDKELLAENRGLYQRVAALQRVERELLAENQNLSRQVFTQRQHQTTRRAQWREEVKKKETRIRELEAQLEQMEGTCAPRLEALLSDKEIATWFDNKDKAWREWAEEFAHHDPTRLTTGLHPAQLIELCEGVRGFVQLTDDGKLPQDLLTGGIDAARTLLHGMVANFICNEAFTNPFWVFNAATLGVLESPATTDAVKSLPPPDRMDLSLFSDISPTRPDIMTPGSPHFSHPLITSMMPPLGGGISSQGLPVRRDFMNLYHMLAQAQPDDADHSPHEWRAALMRLFAEGGMSTGDPALAGLNEARRTIIESRLNYARRLKERFLCGPARLLLHNQDTSGIDRLERLLSALIDDTLRFSCQLWSRPNPLRLQAWKELSTKHYHAANDLMTLCHAQQPRPVSPGAHRTAPEPVSHVHEGRPVIMVVQPAIEALRACGADHEPPARLLLPARVLVATSPRARAPAPIAIEPTRALAPSTGGSQIDTPSDMTRDPVSPDTPHGGVPTPVFNRGGGVRGGGGGLACAGSSRMVKTVGASGGGSEYGLSPIVATVVLARERIKMEDLRIPTTA
ncbi:hypothetical protein B0T18DRAFT_315923 [Schizothecium vesticola]|uniref:Uncharacterized protein n=1 Tax=Schizothecium vesticola TaxID=314040 RepID=A0AA40FCB9_9PEZI|nr:hypothetical protein B0T18DRAFT_315923 [Schizothecium vesticola]